MVVVAAVERVCKANPAAPVVAVAAQTAELIKTAAVA
tara:strand:- start:1188 stop:1298 length:111 start_codon:yes stop_codon:yes gene_type:complete